MNSEQAVQNGLTETKQSRHQYGSIKQRWITNSLSFVAIIIIFAVIFVCFGSMQYFYSSMRIDLMNRATSTAQFMNTFLSRSYEDFYKNASTIVGNFSDRDKLELQIIDSMGRVMFSSSGVSSGFIPSTGDVAQSLSGTSPSVWSGVNPKTGERVMSVSAPLYYYRGQVIGAVRFATSLEKADRQALMISLIALAAGCFVFLLVFASNYYFIRSIVNPVLRLNELSREIAAGSYGVQLETSQDDEIGELCDSINYMSAAISKAEQMKNDIISSVSHELRTPLTAINGWSETLITAGAQNEEVFKQGLDIIHKESRRLSQMVEELLDFARLEAGKLVLHTEVFDLRGEFSDAAFAYTEMLKKDGLAIRYDETESAVMVCGDKDRLRQVFINILDNAAKYGGSGGVIELSIKEENGFALASVRDFGMGIPAEDLPFIKDKFYRGGESAKNRRGAGIGLSVCDEIVKLHNGELEIESRLSVGTTVTIKLPTVPEEEDTPTDEQPQTQN